ncbi:C4-dicarboxylate ABC transporter [Dactylosporangium sp. NPDC005555]|uniref:SLAC1 family transporter n=1 Tax=Dactylosporangium sp. NPDC005555 TaxID=3154889 RepID=UPI00339F7A9F
MRPNRFAAVMGTGIVANAAVTLPMQVDGQRLAAGVVWVVAAALMVVVSAMGGSETRNGALPMAIMTVGAGALLAGHVWVGQAVAVALDAVLWCVGTGIGVITAGVTLFKNDGTAEGPARLLPVVPPLVSASTGALLLPHVPGALRPALLGACLVLLAAGLPVAAWTIAAVCRGPLTAPAVWIVLGPLGQSATAALLLGRATGHATWGLLLAVPVLCGALAWCVAATVVTAATVRSGARFSIGWWSLTFPVGTVVTGVSGAAAQTGSAVVGWLAAGLYLVLVAAWLTVSLLSSAAAVPALLARSPARLPRSAAARSRTKSGMSPARGTCLRSNA